MIIKKDKLFLTVFGIGTQAFKRRNAVWQLSLQREKDGCF